MALDKLLCFHHTSFPGSWQRGRIHQFNGLKKEPITGRCAGVCTSVAAYIKLGFQTVCTLFLEAQLPGEWIATSTAASVTNDNRLCGHAQATERTST
jgi:hypothetical protein